MPDEIFSDEDETSTAVSTHDTKPSAVSPVSLTFEQQKELLMIRHEKVLEEMKQKTELIKLEREQERLKFMNQGKISGDGIWGEKQFNVGSTLQLFPKFSEKDPDLVFFSCLSR